MGFPNPFKKPKQPKPKAIKAYLSFHAILMLGSADIIKRVYFDNKCVFGGVWSRTNPFSDPNAQPPEEELYDPSMDGKPIISGGDWDDKKKAGEYQNWFYEVDYKDDNRKHEIVAEHIFGGIGEQGGVSGDMYIMYGLPTQGVLEPLKETVGKGGDTPSFRGLTGLFFHDFYIGNQSVIKKMSVLVKRVKRTFYGADQWYEAKCQIGQDMNPAHIIREVLVSPMPEWGLNLSENMIDDDSFRKAADVLFNEDLGLSFLWEKEGSASDFIDDVLDHINAYLVTDRVTNKRKLKLIRDDYNFDSLRVLTYNEVAELNSKDSTEISDLHNQVVINFWNRESRGKATITRNNPAVYDATRTINSKSKTYEGCKRYDLAERLAIRDLKLLSTPLTTIKLKCTRLAFNMELGDVFRVNLELEQIEDVAFRVTQLQFDENGNYVTISAIQDIFGFPKFVPNDTPIVQPSNPTPQNVKNVIVSELSYLDAISNVGSQGITELGNNTLLTTFGERAGIETGYSVIASEDNNRYVFHGEGVFNHSIKLKNNITHNQQIIELTTMSGLSVLNTLQINNERMLILNIDYENANITVVRGIEDTHAVSHVANSLVYDLDAMFVSKVPVEIGKLYQVKLVPNINGNSLPSTQTTTYNYTPKGRISAPYPPQNIKINGMYYPELITLSTSPTDGTYFEFSACGRDKIAQGNQLFSWFDDTVYNNSAISYFYEIEGVVPKTQFVPNGNNMRVYKTKAQLQNKTLKIWSEQNGRQCAFKFEHLLKL